MLPLDSKVDKIGFMTCLVIEEILREQEQARQEGDEIKAALLIEALLMTIEMMPAIEE